MTSKPIIACIGNCQSTVIGSFLQSLPELSRTYEFQVLPIGSEEAAGASGKYGATLAYLNKHRERLRLVINQESHEWSRHPIQRADVPAGCGYISYPAAIVNYIWPLIPSYRRPKGVREREFTLFPYTVCDDRVIRLREAGVPRDGLLEEYFKVSPLKAYRVDRLREINLTKLREIDSKADFGIADVVENEMSATQLFSTANHPNGPMMARLLAGITALADGVITDRELADYKIEQRRLGKGVQDVEAPVHPEIAAHFDLAWARDKQFRFWDEGRFSFEDWLLRLYDFSYCRPHQDAMDRIRAGDYEGAEPLLREALVELPDSLPIRQTLAGVLSRRGAVDELVDEWASIYQREPNGGNLDAYYGALSRRGRSEARNFIQSLDHIPDDAIAVRLAFFADTDADLREKAGSQESLHKAAFGHARYWTVEAERARRAKDFELEAKHLARAYYISNWSTGVADIIKKRYGTAPKAERLNTDFAKPAASAPEPSAPAAAAAGLAPAVKPARKVKAVDDKDRYRALRARVEKAELDARLADARAQMAEASARTLQAELAAEEARAALERLRAPAKAGNREAA